MEFMLIIFWFFFCYGQTSILDLQWDFNNEMPNKGMKRKWTESVMGKDVRYTVIYNTYFGSMK